MVLEARLNVAQRIAREAGALLLQHFGRLAQREVHLTARHELVTDLDRRTNRLIVQRLRRAFPQDGTVSEEGRDRVGTSGYTWYIDPLDGTSNYVSQVPYWGISLALVVNGVPVLGVIAAPVRREVFSACAGQGAARNGRSIRASTTRRLAQAFVSVDTHHLKRRLTAALRMEHRLRKACGHTRPISCTALDLAHLAAGRLDGTVMPGPVRLWDVLAGALIAREAGGTVSELSGQPFTLGSRDLVASNGLLHRPLLALL